MKRFPKKDDFTYGTDYVCDLSTSFFCTLRKYALESIAKKYTTAPSYVHCICYSGRFWWNQWIIQFCHFNLFYNGKLYIWIKSCIWQFHIQFYFWHFARNKGTKAWVDFSAWKGSERGVIAKLILRQFVISYQAAPAKSSVAGVNQRTFSTSNPKEFSWQ